MAAEPEGDAPPTPHAAEGIRQLEALPARADAARVEGLESLQRVRSAKAGLLAREQARLTAKYGADHPRVQALAQQISVNRLLVDHVGAEAARAQIAPVDADPKAWILHGRVMKDDLRGQEGLTVALYDSRGAWVQALGFAYTDATGYFKLSAPMGGAKSETPAASEPAVAGSAGPVYAHVLDSRSTTLAADSRALTPTAGRVDYEEIILGLAGPPGGTPADGSKRKPLAPRGSSQE